MITYLEEEATTDDTATPDTEVEENASDETETAEEGKEE